MFVVSVFACRGTEWLVGLGVVRPTDYFYHRERSFFNLPLLICSYSDQNLSAHLFLDTAREERLAQEEERREKGAKDEGEGGGHEEDEVGR